MFRRSESKKTRQSTGVSSRTRSASGSRDEGNKSADSSNKKKESAAVKQSVVSRKSDTAVKSGSVRPTSRRVRQVSERMWSRTRLVCLTRSTTDSGQGAEWKNVRGGHPVVEADSPAAVVLSFSFSYFVFFSDS